MELFKEAYKLSVNNVGIIISAIVLGTAFIATILVLAINKCKKFFKKFMVG